MPAGKRRAFHIFIGVLSSALAAVAFYACLALALLILAFVFDTLMTVDVFRALLRLLLFKRGDTAESFLAMVSAGAAYFCTSHSLSHFVKREIALKVSCISLGVILVALNVVYLIGNIFEGNPVISNICIVAAGIAFIIKGKGISVADYPAPVEQHDAGSVSQKKKKARINARLVPLVLLVLLLSVVLAVVLLTHRL